MRMLSPAIEAYKNGDPWQIWIDVFTVDKNKNTSILNQFAELPFLEKVYYKGIEGGLSIAILHAHPSPKSILSIVQSIVEKNFSDVKYNIHTGA